MNSIHNNDNNDIEAFHDPEIHRNADFWFPDGSVVIVCAGVVACRVHHGVLSIHSNIFRDMIERAITEDGERIDGCPVLRVSEPYDDARHLLALIYHRRFAQAKGSLDLRTIACLLRLAATYEVRAVHAELVEHLEFLFPSTLAAFQSPERLRAIPPNFDPLPAIDLSFTYSIPSILPAALYMCSRFNELTLFHLYKLAHTTVSFRALEAVVLFKLRAMRAIDLHTGDGTTFPVLPCCAVPYACPGLTAHMMQRAAQTYRSLGLDFFQECFVYDAFGPLCVPCGAEWIYKETAYQSFLWECLPSFCGEAPDGGTYTWDILLHPQGL